FSRHRPLRRRAADAEPDEARVEGSYVRPGVGSRAMDAAVALRRPHGHAAVEGAVRFRVAPISLRWSDAGGALRGARLHHRGNFLQSLARAGPSLSSRLPAVSRLGALCAVSILLGDAAVSSAGTCGAGPDVL